MTAVKYLLLICANEQTMDAMPEAARAARSQEWGTYTQQLADAKLLRAGERLHPVASATTIRRNGGAAPLISDGPFVETKEQLGGYYVIEARNLDEAVEWANKMPHLGDPDASVEIRPIWDM